MTTSTSTSTRPPDARPAFSLAAQLAHVAIVYATFAKTLDGYADVTTDSGVTFQGTFEHEGVKFTGRVEFGVFTPDVPDPDIAGHIATIAGLTSVPAHSSRWLHLWRGVVCDMPVVVVGHGPERAALTGAVLQRVLADIRRDGLALGRDRVTGEERYAKAEALEAFAVKCAEKSAPYKSTDEQYVILRDSISVTLTAARHAALALAAFTRDQNRTAGEHGQRVSPAPAAWAALDAQDKVFAVRIERDEAEVYVEFTDGERVAPLVLADLDGVAEVTR